MIFSKAPSCWWKVQSRRTGFTACPRYRFWFHWILLHISCFFMIFPFFYFSHRRIRPVRRRGWTWPSGRCTAPIMSPRKKTKPSPRWTVPQCSLLLSSIELMSQFAGVSVPNMMLKASDWSCKIFFLNFSHKSVPNFYTRSPYVTHVHGIETPGFDCDQRGKKVEKSTLVERGVSIVNIGQKCHQQCWLCTILFVWSLSQ